MLRKYFKSKNRTEDITAITANSSNDQDEVFQKTIEESEISFMDKAGYKSQKALEYAFEWWAKNIVLRFPIWTLLFSALWTGALIAGFKGYCLIVIC